MSCPYSSNGVKLQDIPAVYKEVKADEMGDLALKMALAVCLEELGGCGVWKPPSGDKHRS